MAPRRRLPAAERDGGNAPGPRRAGDGSAPAPEADGRTVGEVALVARGRSNALVDLEAHRDLGTLDVVFPVLHGPYGEDGTVQGLLRAGRASRTSAPACSARRSGMDKDVMKRLLRDAGIPIGAVRAPSTRAPDRPSFDGGGRARSGLPLFVKPANLGSSVGVSKVRTAGGVRRAAATWPSGTTARSSSRSASTAREIECAVLGNDEPVASVPGEVCPRTSSTTTRPSTSTSTARALEIPARLDAATGREVRDLAVRAFRVLDCAGMARVDFFLDARTGELLVNEINTIPGFTPISMYPKLWEASGVPYRELVDRLIRLAIERHEAERGLKTSV